MPVDTELFGGSDTGVVWDGSLATDLHTDVTGTTDVTTDGDTIKAVRDRRGNYMIFDAVGTLPATYKTNILNGHSVIRCATTRLQTTFASNEVIIDLTKPISTLIIARQTTVGDEMLWIVDGAEFYRFRTNGGTQQIRAGNTSGTPLYDENTGAGAATWAMYGLESDAINGTAGNLSQLINGGPILSKGMVARATSTGFDNYCLGSNYGAEYLVGDFAYKFLINRALKASEWDLLGLDKSAKYGLTWNRLLPSGSAWDRLFSVQRQGGTNGTGNTAARITTGCNIIIINVGWYGGTTSDVTVSDSAGNTWTPLTKYNNGAVNLSTRFFYCINPTTSTTHTFEASGTATYPAICVGGFSASGTISFDVQNGATTGVATGAITPSQADCLVVAGLVTGSAHTILTVDSGLHLKHADWRSATNQGTGLAWKVHGNTSITGTFGGSGWATSPAFNIASFKVQGGNRRRRLFL